MPRCCDQLQTVLTKLPSHVQVIIATKYATPSDMIALDNQQLPIIFGENRLQDGIKRQAAIPNSSIPWHFIGHVQRNKLTKILAAYKMIQSVDRLSLIEAIQIQSKKIQKITPILLQVNPLNEPQKHGFDASCVEQAAEMCHNHSHIQLKGVMCMAPHTQSHTDIEKTFRMTRKMYDKMRQMNTKIDTLSMGMSNDYKIAINEGSTMIRLGRILFT